MAPGSAVLRLPREAFLNSELKQHFQIKLLPQQFDFTSSVLGVVGPHAGVCLNFLEGQT